MPPAKHVLIIDDDLEIRCCLEEQLRLLGYDVTTSADGLRGKQEAIDRPYDLIITDMMMPGQSGFRVIEQLREEGQHMPIIMMSGQHHPHQKKLALFLGATEFFTKPFDMESLLDRVAVLCPAGPPAGDETLAPSSSAHTSHEITLEELPMPREEG